MENIQKPPVIILDGNQRSALAATRSLGMKGIDVIVGAEGGRSLASSLRFCKRFFSYPSQDYDAEAFLHAVLETSGQYDRSVLLPMADVTVNEILLNRNLFPKNMLIPFSDHLRYDALSDKEKLFRQAEKLAISMPETLFSSDFTSREALSFSHNSIMPSKPPNTGRGRGIARHYRGVGSGADRYLATVLRESPSRLAICRTGQCCTRLSLREYSTSTMSSIPFFSPGRKTSCLPVSITIRGDKPGWLNFRVSNGDK